MNKITCLLVLLITSCGKPGAVGVMGPIGIIGGKGEKGDKGDSGTSCLVTTVEPSELVPTGGALITCGETNSLLVNGAQGATGSQGEDGVAGLSAYELWLDLGNEGTLSEYLTSLVGETGEQGATGQNGSNGTNGQNGSAGTNGTNGTNGSAGAQGPQGLQGPAGLPSAYSIVEVLNPCGYNGLFDEIFLRLQNGLVLVSFSDNANGTNTRLALLKTGNFGTTDGYNCSFSAVINNNGTGSLSWIGGGVTW